MKNYLSIMRFSHWSKNIFLFVALVFGGKLVGPIDEVLLAIGSAVGGFFCFSMAASAIYIFNDIVDRKTDRLHPEKSQRPIAAGAITIAPAAVMSVLCALIAIIGSLADTANLGDFGSSRVYPSYVITPLEGIKKLAGDSIDIVYDKGNQLGARQYREG